MKMFKNTEVWCGVYHVSAANSSLTVCLTSFTPAVFEVIKEELRKPYFNMLIKSEVLAKRVSVGKA